MKDGANSTDYEKYKKRDRKRKRKPTELNPEESLPRESVEKWPLDSGKLRKIGQFLVVLHPQNCCRSTLIVDHLVSCWHHSEKLSAELKMLSQ